MIWLIMLSLSGLQNSGKVEPADWFCATPLIEKNYQQNFSARRLALRISNECARPFSSTEQHESLRVGSKRIYDVERAIFQQKIEQQIISLRNRDEIKLIR